MERNEHLNNFTNEGKQKYLIILKLKFYGFIYMKFYQNYKKKNYVYLIYLSIYIN